MTLKVLTHIEATSLVAAACDLAVSIAAAFEVDDGDVVLVGPFDPILREGAVVALRVVVARQARQLLVSNIVPVGICAMRGSRRSGATAACGPSTARTISSSRPARRSACCTEEGRSHALDV